MTSLLFMLAFIFLYGLSLIGGPKAKWFFTSGLLLHAGYVLYRFIYLGRLPVTERHDILLVMALAVGASYFYFYKKNTPSDMLLDTLPLFMVVLLFFALFQERIDTIEPNMNSIWFYIYIIFFIAGYVFLTVSSVSGVFYLRGKALLYEVIQYRMALYGWLLFSFSLIGGSVWFYLTYGSYWLWTAKELWITIVWFYYSFYLHGRMLKRLSGTPSVILGIAGFPVTLFTYLGVTPVLGSPWSQF